MVGERDWRVRGPMSLLLSVSLIALAVRCDDEKPFVSQILTFVFPMNILPSDSVVSLGANLWIVANISDSLFEYHTKTKYKLQRFDFGQTSIGIRKL
jgi:hypothetical protein